MKKIIENQTAFSVNLAEEKTELLFSKEQLVGVPDNTLATFGRKEDAYIVTMKYPDVFGVLENCSVGDTRRQVMTAFNNRGGQKNIDLLTETVCTKKDSLIIAGDVYPAAVVKSKLLKLDAGHIEYVIDCMKSNTTEVRNIKKYLLAALFNAPSTMDSYYTARVNHDLYGHE